MTDTKHNTPWTAKRIGDSNFWRIRDANEKLVTQGISEYYAKITLAHVNNHAPLVEALEKQIQECFLCNHTGEVCEICDESKKVLANAKGATDD